MKTISIDYCLAGVKFPFSIQRELFALKLHVLLRLWKTQKYNVSVCLMLTRMANVDCFKVLNQNGILLRILLLWILSLSLDRTFQQTRDKSSTIHIFKPPKSGSRVLLNIFNNDLWWAYVICFFRFCIEKYIRFTRVDFHKLSKFHDSWIKLRYRYRVVLYFQDGCEYASWKLHEDSYARLKIWFHVSRKNHGSTWANISVRYDVIWWLSGTSQRLQNILEQSSRLNLHLKSWSKSRFQNFWSETKRKYIYISIYIYNIMGSTVFLLILFLQADIFSCKIQFWWNFWIFDEDLMT